MARGPQHSLRPILCICVLIPPLVFAAMRWVSLAAYPYDWDPGEGDNIFYAWQLAQGQCPYGDYEQYPMTGSCYPPVYHALCAPLVAAFGRHVLIGRFISWTALITTSLLIWILARRHGAASWAALAAAVLYIVCPPAQRWAALARVDSLMTALGLASLAMLTVERPRRIPAILGAMTGAAAVYTKPYAVLFLLSGLVVLALRSRRLALMSATLAAAVGFGALCLLQWWSDGWFWNNVISANATDFSWDRMVSRELVFLLQHAVVIILACAALTWKEGKARPALLAGLIAGSIISLFTGKLGGTDNYQLPLAAVLTTAAGTSLDASWPFKRTWIPVCALVVQSALWFQLGIVETPTAADRAAMDHLAADLAEIHGEVLIERNASLQAIAGKEMVWEPSLLWFLYRAGKWNGAQLIDDIRGGRFVGILTSGLIVPPIIDEITRQFSLAKTYEIHELEGNRTHQLFLRRRPPG